MKKIFNFILLVLVAGTLSAQTASLVHSQSGSVKAIKTNGIGLLVLMQDDTGDRLVYSADGISNYSNILDFVQGSGEQLTSFSDDGMAMILGDKNDGLGTELYSVDDGVASLVLDHSNFSTGKPDTIMGRIYDGVDYQFCYTLRTTEQYGEIIAELGNDLWYTDGTDYGTWDLSLANMRINNHSGFIEFNGRIYYGGNLYNLGRSCDTRIYSLPVSNLFDVAQEDVAFYNVDCLFSEPENLVATESDIYCTFIEAHNGHKSLHRMEEVSVDAPAGLYRMIDLVQVGREDVVRDQVSVSDGMVSIGNKLYCIISENTLLESIVSDVVISEVEKLYAVEGRQYTVVSNIKGDGISDELSELIQSGDYLYFFSGEGTDKKLFRYDVNLQDGAHYIVDAPYATHLTATHNGVVYTTGEGDDMNVLLTNGETVNEISMPVEYNGKVSHLITSGNNVFAVHTEGADTHISYFIADITASAEQISRYKTNITLSPNPVESLLNIHSTSAITQIDLYSVTGVNVLVKRSGDLSKLDMSALTRGIYIIKITDIQGNTIIQKVNKL